MTVKIPEYMKITCKVIVIIFLVTISIFGCNTNPDTPGEFLNVSQNKVELTFTPNGENNEIKLPLDHIFDEDNVDFLSLNPDENGEGLLVMPVTIYSLDQNWLVYDPRNKKSSALLFDQDGGFIRYVGTKGKGPGEYVATGLCKLNRKRRRIEIFDGGTNRLLIYNYDGQYINTIDVPMIFSDFIPGPYQDGYYLYTLDNFNTGFMPKYSLGKDYVITKTDTLFQPIFGIEEITLNPNVNPYRNNGNKLFQYGKDIGFINNYSNDLYLLKNDIIESLISFEIEGIEFQPKEYIKNPDGNRFLNTLEKGFSFVGELSISENKILEYIMASSPDPNRRYDPVFLFYDMNNQNYAFYSVLEDSSGTYTIGEFYLHPHSSSYDAFAMIHPKDIDGIKKSSHPVHNKILSLREENNKNPIIALLKFK